MFAVLLFEELYILTQFGFLVNGRRIQKIQRMQGTYIFLIKKFASFIN